MTDFLDQLEHNIECPRCKNNIKVTLGQIKRGEIVKCLKCNSELRLVNENGGIKKVDDELNKLKKIIDETKINIKFKL